MLNRTVVVKALRFSNPRADLPPGVGSNLIDSDNEGYSTRTFRRSAEQRNLAEVSGNQIFTCHIRRLRTSTLAMTKLSFSTTLAVSLVAACTANPVTDQAPEPTTSAHAPDAHEMQATATVVSPTGTTIEFFAVSSGGYFALEHGEVGQAAVLTHEDIATRSLADVYRKATGKSEVPAAIATLSENVLATDAVSPPLTVSPMERPSSAPAQLSGTHTTAAGGSCSSSYFTSNGGCPTGAARTWCLLDWWNGAYEYTSQTDLSFASICADIGSVMWQIQNGDGGFHQISVLQGQWYNYSLHDGGQTWLHYDVLQASGDRFQFGGEMYSY